MIINAQFTYEFELQGMEMGVNDVILLTALVQLSDRGSSAECCDD